MGGLKLKDGQSVYIQKDAVVIGSSHVYHHDARSRRDRADREDGAYWDYGCNDRGEVVSGQKRLPGGAAMGGFGFGYGFDSIGNWDWVARGGDGFGGDASSKCGPTASRRPLRLTAFTRWSCPPGSGSGCREVLALRN